MTRKLLASTAIAALLATGAMAQDGEEPTEMTVQAEGNLASNIMDESVYNGTGEDADSIGDVTDIVFNQDGSIEAIVVGVGGFLGIGQKDVAIEYDTVEWAELDGERYLVVETTTEALEDQEDFDRSAYEPMPADSDVSETEPASEEDLDASEEAQASEDGEPAAGDEDAMSGEESSEASGEEDMSGDEAAETSGEEEPAQSSADEEMNGEEGAAMDEDAAADEESDAAAGEDAASGEDATTGEGTEANGEAAATGAVDRSELEDVSLDQIRAEDFVGTTVYGADDEHIGEIGDVILNSEGEVDAALVDVGGFLGIGEKEVAIGMDNLSFMADQDENLHLYTEFTEQELDEQPEYDEENYADERDEQLLQVE